MDSTCAQKLGVYKEVLGVSTSFDDLSSSSANMDGSSCIIA